MMTFGCYRHRTKMICSFQASPQAREEAFPPAFESSALQSCCNPSVFIWGVLQISLEKPGTRYRHVRLFTTQRLELPFSSCHSLMDRTQPSSDFFTATLSLKFAVTRAVRREGKGGKPVIRSLEVWPRQ
jgi:hypothetical protein